MPMPYKPIALSRVLEVRQIYTIHYFEYTSSYAFAGEEVLDAEGKKDTVFTYNAKAHPHLSEGSRLLISYNTNIWNGENTPYCYHPRFIWLDLETI